VAGSIPQKLQGEAEMFARYISIAPQNISRRD
jgi:hypothetical protein